MSQCQAYFETSDFKLIDRDHIVLIEPITIDEYKKDRLGFDDNLQHTPYTNEELKEMMLQPVFAYEVHLDLPAGGRNFDHKVIFISVADFKRLREKLWVIGGEPDKKRAENNEK